MKDRKSSNVYTLSVCIKWISVYVRIKVFFAFVSEGYKWKKSQTLNATRVGECDPVPRAWMRMLQLKDCFFHLHSSCPWLSLSVFLAWLSPLRPWSSQETLMMRMILCSLSLSLSLSLFYSHAAWCLAWSWERERGSKREREKELTLKNFLMRLHFKRGNRNGKNDWRDRKTQELDQREKEKRRRRRVKRCDLW